MCLYKVPLSNIMSISESSEDKSAFCVNHPSISSSSSQSTQLTVIRAHGLNIIPPFDIVVLQSHSDASQLITVCTLKYTNARVRSFVNELLFNYNFTWTLPISGANRVSPSVHNYSGCNCSACLWNMLIPQRGHLKTASVSDPLWERLSATKWFLFKAADRAGTSDGQQAPKLEENETKKNRR